MEKNLACCRTNVIETSAGNIRLKLKQFLASSFGLDCLVGKALRCDRKIPGSNPDLDRYIFAKQIFGRGSTKTDHIKQLTLLKSRKINPTKSSTI